MSDSNEVPVKKKRGRKPKVKTESELNNTEPKVPKKRGRKPKVKSPEDLIWTFKVALSLKNICPL